MMTHTNINFCFVGTIFVMAYHTKNPTDHEWELFLKTIKSNKAPKAVLLSSEGGAPSARQRKQLRETLNVLQTAPEKTPPMAMLSTSVLVRVALTALGAFLPNAPVAYPPTQWREIAAHLRLSWEETLLAAEALNKLRRDISLRELPIPSRAY